MMLLYDAEVEEYGNVEVAKKRIQAVQCVCEFLAHF